MFSLMKLLFELILVSLIFQSDVDRPGARGLEAAGPESPDDRR